MTDFKELREALEAQAAHPEFELGLWGIYTEMFVPDSIDHADIEYIKAANPSVIRALLAELDEVRKDAERLDWLDAEVSGDPGGRRILCLPGALRSAIDAAMKEQQP